MDKENADMGRCDMTKEDKDKGAFKTPTLRNIALTAPYMHDGSIPTLQKVIDFYELGGTHNPYLSEKIRVLQLT